MKPMNNDKLFLSVKELIENARSYVVRNVNTAMLYTNYTIGQMIVEEEQNGNTRAGYAEMIVKNLSVYLTTEYGKGFSQRNLDNYKRFYLLYRERIAQTVFAQSDSPIGKPSEQALLAAFAENFKIGWSHYILLMKINQAEERAYYESEAATANWSFRELERQYSSSLFERLMLSRDKKSVKEDIDKDTITEPAIDALKTPFVLEFLSLKEDSSYSENDLETAIIDKLEHFMLELGKGFLFEGRQRRITLEGDHFWVDLVFYNRLLDCFVLIDLKIGKLTHQDIGQMQMYVNYYDRKIKSPHEKPTLGIILCKENSKAVVEYTLPLNNEQIFSREYKLYLPSKEELQKQLL
ncbi:MAG: PDDEXK nuclease domain-containing protein [Bacteroidota bacterium]